MTLKHILRGWRTARGAFLHPRRIFLEIGLFSGFSKAEVNEYIAATRNRRGRKASHSESPLAAPLLRFAAYLGQ